MDRRQYLRQRKRASSGRPRARVYRAVLAPDPLYCGLCGGRIDKSLPRVTIRGVPPHPWSAVVDHIIEIDSGGDPLDPDNLQAAHRRCNEIKEAKRRTWAAAARRNAGELAYGSPMQRAQRRVQDPNGPTPIVGADP